MKILPTPINVPVQCVLRYSFKDVFEKTCRYICRVRSKPNLGMSDLEKKIAGHPKRQRLRLTSKL